MDVFQEKAQSYDQWFVENEALFQSEKEAVKKMMPAREDLAAPAIEIGVGTGLFASALGIEEGLEPSEDMGRVARQRGIRVIQSPAETMPMASESYGMALMVTVDCFLADVEQAFSEVNRILVPGGWFVIAFLDRETPLGQIYQANKDSDDLYRYATFHSAEEIRAYLEGAGFAVEDGCQTVFSFENCVQEVLDGHGKGVFGVMRGRKK